MEIFLQRGLDDPNQLEPKGEFFSAVIPGRAKHEPGIYNPCREYGFRACAKRRIPE
jgi:hypothetical protein